MTGGVWRALGATVLVVGGLLGPVPGHPPPPPLLDAQGHARAPWSDALPADPRLRTRSGLYATGAQVLALEQALGAGVVHVSVDGTPERAVAAVRRVLARRGLPASAPVVVAGADLYAAAQVADQLTASGHTCVWLVTR